MTNNTKKKSRREYYKKWREKNKERIRLIWKKYYYLHRDELNKRRNKQIKKREEAYQTKARKYHRLRIQASKMYGGDFPKCAYCGENRYECLQIDHIHDDGWKQRQGRIFSGASFYRWLIKQPYQPDKYQVLCANCNAIKRTRGIIAYNQGFKDIKEWEEWAKCKYIKTPKEIKKLW